jgi:hypothetical protein
MNTSPEKPSRSPILSPMSSPEMYPLSDEENYMDFDSSDFSLDYIDDSLFNLFIGTPFKQSVQVRDNLIVYRSTRIKSKRNRVR